MSEQTVGVVVARLQVPALHTGHRYLIDQVLARHKTVVVFLGERESFPSRRRPMDFVTRKEMVLESYPNVVVYPIYDSPSDHLWSRQLDEALVEIFGNKQMCILYCSRDSFAERYHGEHAVAILPPASSVAGTDLRDEVVINPRRSHDFRCGMIYATMRRFPLVFPTVDIAILSGSRHLALLGSKAHDDGALRLVGGFVDTKDHSMEGAARREAYEETGGIELADFRVIGTARVDDFRYRDTEDRIITTLFVATYVYGIIRPSSDLEKLEWVSFQDVKTRIHPIHKPLWEMVEEFCERERGERKG